MRKIDEVIGNNNIKEAIIPYHINIPDERLTVIRTRVESYDWNLIPDAGAWNSGVGIKDLRRLVDYWLNQYDWRKVERHLNLQPHFTTDIDGERIHFIHIQGNKSKPPLLLLHGWPGSFIEFEKLLEPLSADGHDIIIPSLPGFAFSTPITGIIGVRRVAELMHRLMARLFAESRYIVQGGDWGANIASWMAYLFPNALLGIHVNMVNIYAADTEPSTPEEIDFFFRRDKILDWETGYSHEQGTRPQTLGIAMADSPVGAAAWILEKFGKWSDLPILPDGSPNIWSKYSEELLLTNIMLYIGPPSVVTATWIYQGKRLEKSAAFPAGTQVSVPMGIAAFPDPVFLPTPHSFAGKIYNVLRYTDMPKGGHFAALEEPELLLADLRAFINSLALHKS